MAVFSSSVVVSSLMRRVGRVACAACPRLHPLRARALCSGAAAAAGAAPPPTTAPSSPASYLVTGGARGLGLAAARALLHRGHAVVLCDIDAEGGAAAAADLGAEFGGPGARVVFCRTDVSSEDDVRAAIAAGKDAFGGGLRGAINCAGVLLPSKMLGKKGVHPLEPLVRTLTVNVVGTFNVCRLVAETLAAAEPYTPDGERGVLVNTASIAALEGQVGQAAYSASKGAILGLTMPFVREFRRVGIRVNVIAPGTFRTPMLESLPPPVLDALGKQVPFPSRLGEPHEFGSLVDFIVHNHYVNGEVFRIDGGIRMQ